MEKMAQYTANPLRCYKFQKYGHHKDNSRRREVCEKYGHHEPDQHHINEFLHKCANCSGNYPVYARSCESWRLKKKEILTIKHKNDIH